MRDRAVRLVLLCAVGIGGIVALRPVIGAESVSMVAGKGSNDVQILPASLFHGLLDHESSGDQDDNRLLFVARDSTDGSLWGYGTGYGLHMRMKAILSPFWGFSFPPHGRLVEDAEAIGIPVEKYQTALAKLHSPIYLGKFTGPGKTIELSEDWRSLIQERYDKFEATLIEAVGSKEEFLKRYKQIEKEQEQEVRKVLEESERSLKRLRLERWRRDLEERKIP